MNSIVFVYTNGWQFKNIIFTDWLIYPIVFHKGKFKATNYFSRYSNFSSTLSVSTSSFALCLSISIHVGDCWKNSMVWIRNWYFLCSLEDVIKSGKNHESHIGKERNNIWVYMLMSWTLGWAFGICGLGLLVQIIIFYYFNFWVS